MAQVIAAFDTPVADHAGRVYLPRVWGERRADGRWEGWIEFQDTTTSHVLTTDRETTQPNLHDLQYWASGLTEVYLEGALDRVGPVT
jgi:hypothetical protein